jgi:hypothetical protein
MCGKENEINAYFAWLDFAELKEPIGGRKKYCI